MNSAAPTCLAVLPSATSPHHVKFAGRKAGYRAGLRTSAATLAPAVPELGKRGGAVVEQLPGAQVLRRTPRRLK